ncbi:MAG: hypothetical protein PHW56_08700 [Methanosarcinaceae archaeon]|nr:hypothetical protein [Methanosarcinaceae archaeon]
MNYKLITAGTAGRACGLVEVAPGYEAGSRSVFSRAVVHFGCGKLIEVLPGKTTPVYSKLWKIPEVKLKLSAEPPELPADGISKSELIVSIEGPRDIPVPMPMDVKVFLSTSLGLIDDSALIRAGHASTTAVLTSSREAGTARIEAKCKRLLKGNLVVEFKEGDDGPESGPGRGI